MALRAIVCPCSSLPLSLKGPKGEGDQGGEGSLPMPQKCDINPLTQLKRPFYTTRHGTDTVRRP